jgi:heterodisulfide reductase subunit A
MTQEILIIGGGPAGLSAARSLLDRGANVVIVERSESLGGMARELTCKGLTECRNCGACYAIDRANEIMREPRAEVLLLSEIASLNKTEKGFQVKIKVGARYVNNDCIGCGKCLEVCPVEGKAINPPTGSGQPRVHWIDRQKCLHFRKAKCTKCSEVCPTQAVNYEDRARNVTRNVSAVVFATGIQPVDPCEVSRLGCGSVEDVISSVDAERILNEKGVLVRPSDGAPPKKVAVLQCVGSRSSQNGVDYCSKFCCKYATKISQLMLDNDPEINLDFYFMDLRTLHEPQDEFKRWAKERKTVRLIRSMPAVVQQGSDGKVMVRVATENDSEIQENGYDLVILSVGMRPSGADTELAKSLGIRTDERGFAEADPQSTANGIFVVGAVSEPMDIEETVIRSVSSTSSIRTTAKEVPQ